MNKGRIDEMIPIAYEALKTISDNGKIKKTYRGGVSSFGAAVSMGSLLSAAAFFSADSSGASYDRKKLGKVIVKTATCDVNNDNTLYKYVKEAGDSCKDKVMDAAVAVKLAMNLYELEK